MSLCLDEKVTTGQLTQLWGPSIATPALTLWKSSRTGPTTPATGGDDATDRALTFKWGAVDGARKAKAEIHALFATTTPYGGASL